MVTQLLANGLIAGCAYALVALGFALIYNTTRTFHFAHGAVYTLSAYFFYTLRNLWEWPLIPAFVVTLLIIAVLGILIDEFLYMPLVKRGSSQLIQLLSSLGLYIVLINFIAMIYGNETKVLNPGVQPTFSIGSLILTQIQVATAIVFVALFIGLIVLLKKTRLGKIIRAMRDDSQLVSVMGINPRRVRRVVFAMGSALAAVAAMLLGLDVGIDPNIGMAAVLNGAVAVIIGGVGIFTGAAVGALLLGILQSLAIWQASARWQDMVTFLVLILFLLFRPEGILGVRRRIEEATA
ncbi:MAG: branched-chain amino acid ABC transporter permease [candidate division KSB1 bacterium]|nr:branched-chain amino acid ABC transporter permease [candidate division KSB1 bacterium]